MTMIVDAHQHFWRYGTYQTSWMEVPPYAGDPVIRPIRRSFEPGELWPEMEATGVDATITVEAADEVEENDALLAHAYAHAWIGGVVGWIPLAQPYEAARMLDTLGRERKFVGVRHLINVEPDPDWILSEQVIDRLGKPPIAPRKFEPWGTLLRLAAQAPNVYAKLSGLDAGEADHWSAAEIQPYVEHALEWFGPERLMFGSDWPVAVVRGGYSKIWHETNAALAGLGQEERDQILGGTAIRVYRLPLATPEVHH